MQKRLQVAAAVCESTNLMFLGASNLLLNPRSATFRAILGVCCMLAACAHPPLSLGAQRAILDTSFGTGLLERAATGFNRRNGYFGESCGDGLQVESGL